MSMFPLTARQIKTSVVECIEAGLVPFVQSSPGLGKSSIFAQIADEFDLEMIDIRLSQTVPEDMMGLPMRGDNGKANFMPFEMFPTEDTPIPNGKNGWLLALDEFNSGTKSVQAAAYKLVLDRYAGQFKLHDNVFIVTAGNLETDKAIVNRLSTAMQSRLIHLEMSADLQSFMEYAVQSNFDYRITGFLEFQPSKLHRFDPDHTDRTFPCPRTWEFVSKLISGKEFKNISLPVLAGAIGDGTAIEFHAFLKEFENLPRYSDILADPKKAPVLHEPSAKFAMVTMLVDRLDKQDFPKIVEYVHKLPSEFQVVYFRNVVHKDKTMRDHPDYQDNINHLVKFLNDVSDDKVAA